MCEGALGWDILHLVHVYMEKMTDYMAYCTVKGDNVFLSAPEKG